MARSTVETEIAPPVSSISLPSEVDVRGVPQVVRTSLQISVFVRRRTNIVNTTVRIQASPGDSKEDRLMTIKQ